MNALIYSNVHPLKSTHSLKPFLGFNVRGFYANKDSGLMWTVQRGESGLSSKWTVIQKNNS